MNGKASAVKYVFRVADAWLGKELLDWIVEWSVKACMEQERTQFSSLRIKVEG
jgi:hypothetical protein